MSFSFSSILENKTGQIIISIILGLGLASLFRRVCSGRNCIIVKGPQPKKLNNKIYKYDNTCYKYKAVQTKCQKDNIKIQLENDEKISE